MLANWRTSFTISLSKLNPLRTLGISTTRRSDQSERFGLDMDVNLEVASGDDLDPGLGSGTGAGDGAGTVTDETLIGTIGGKGEGEAGGPDGENTMVEVMSSDGIGKGEGSGEAAEIECRGDRGLVGAEMCNSGVQETAAGGDAGEGDGGGSIVVGVLEGVKSGVAEKEATHMVHEKLTAVVDDNLLEEDVDVDIDDSGDVRTVVPSQSVDKAAGEVGTGNGTAEDTAKLSSFGTSSDKLKKERETIVEGVGVSPLEETYENDGKMEQVRVDQDYASEETVSGKSGASHSSPHRDGGTVRNIVGESEDEEVDIGDHEENLFTNQKLVIDEDIRSEPTENVLHASYLLPAEKEGAFSVSDLVWGKVRSHPWWPGQIFDLSDSSEIAMKRHKKDCYLVAFFGDRTFAWSEASQLRRFRAHFSHVEKQSNSEALHHAISCALEEVSRRVELGLACRCIQTDLYEKLRYQLVDNTGIQDESSRRESTDESASAYSCEPRNLLRYIKSLAQFPSIGADQLEIVIAKAQLMSFYRLKGYNHLPEYQFTELSLKNGAETVTDSGFAEEGQLVESQSDSHLKRKHNMRDIVYSSKRDRSMPELMDERMLLMGEDYEDDETFLSSSASLLSSKKQNAGYAPKQSFKIGDCILRAASQMTGSLGPSSFLKSINEKYQKVNESNGARLDVPVQHVNPNVNSSSSVADDMRSHLQAVAHDPKKEHSSISTSTNLFSAVRNTTLSPDKAVDVRKTSRSIKGSPETFEFEDMKDSYWTDRVIQNGGEEKPEHKEQKLNYQIVTLESQASLSRSPRVHSRKRYSNGNHKITAERPTSAIDKSKQDLLPAELILNFPDTNSVPSESKLNNMFRRFGPLKEFETEVDRESNRARIVFKRSSDAEVAYSSCEKFNIFGSTVVRYELSYTPSVSYKASRIPATQGMETVTLPELDFASSTHDLEFITMQELEDATMQDLQYPHAHDLEGVTMQDLEFTTTHDLEFPESQDLDIVSTHVPEVPTIQGLDVSAQNQHLETSEMHSSGVLELQVGENVIDGCGAASQDIEIATAENQQRANQDPSIKTLDDLESIGVQETEAVTVQHFESVQNPETASEVSAQGADNSGGQDQDTEVTATEDVDATTIDEEQIVKDHDSESGELLGQDKDSTDKHVNTDVAGLQELENGTDDPMILSEHGVEQGTNQENYTILSNQSADEETNRENDTQESQVVLGVDDAPVELEMLAPEVVKKQEPVESDATEDFVILTRKDAESETVGGISTAVAAREIGTSDDNAAAVAQDTELEATDPDANLKKQVSPNNVEIIESQAEGDPSVAGSAEDEARTSVENDA